ncbi:O-antigen polymerase [Clostridium carnis]
MIFRIRSKKDKLKYNLNSISVEKNNFKILLILFIISTIYFLKNYIPLLIQLDFQLNVINAAKYSSQIIAGLWGYLFMLGIPLILLLPFTNIKYKKVITTYILFIYLLYTRRLYFIMSAFILVIINFTHIKKKISKKYMLIIGILFLLFFNLTQTLLNKTIYNVLILTYDNVHSRLYSIILDPLIYIVGNISNIDMYVQQIPPNTYFLEKTLYPVYSILNTIGICNPPNIPNPFFVNGLFRTNTIAFPTYYLSDGGLLFCFFMLSFIMIFNETISSYSTEFNIIIKPFLIACAFLSFRQNDYVLIYFYVVFISLWLVTHLNVKNKAKER